MLLMIKNSLFISLGIRDLLYCSTIISGFSLKNVFNVNKEKRSQNSLIFSEMSIVFLYFLFGISFMVSWLYFLSKNCLFTKISIGIT
jgi:hypothetical protein